MRLGCVLVSVAVLASLVLEPPKARAEALVGGIALVGAFLNACGLAPVVAGVGSTQGVSDALERMVREYVLEKEPASDAAAWLGKLAVKGIFDRKLVLEHVTAAALGAFARWVAGKYAAKPGVNEVFSDQGIKLGDSLYHFTTYSFKGSVENGSFQVVSFNLGTPIPAFSDTGMTSLSVSDSNLSFRFWISGTHYCVGLYDGDNRLALVEFVGLDFFDPMTLTFCPRPDSLGFTIGMYSPDIERYLPNQAADFQEYIDSSALINGGLSLDVSNTMQEILDRLTALEEGQSIALDVGATQSMELQEILQSILEKILAGDLTATAEVVDTAEVPVEPPDPPVVPELPTGLDKLGAALTSRFPFSIPWDVYKGVKLLAAPAKAPYFEVDFFEPIGHLVGGWQGSTKIVLDMSEYEIIGQVSRWASTIGFCLMLASGTKRLIWTA